MSPSDSVPVWDDAITRSMEKDYFFQYQTTYIARTVIDTSKSKYYQLSIDADCLESLRFPRGDPILRLLAKIQRKPFPDPPQYT